MKQKLRVFAEILVLLALFGAFFYFSVGSAHAQQICTTTCQWVGDVWICETVCF
jgi:hypothetical protein